MAGPSYEFRSLTISGDFTNSQIKGNYIDCTGATFSMYFYDTRWGSDYAKIIQGSDFLNGEATGTIQNADFGYPQYVITASPAQFSSTGQQIVTFTATVDRYGSQNTTKSVNVISSEPTDKFVIDAELYEEIDTPETGYTVTFTSASLSARLTIQINDGEAQSYTSITSGTTLTDVETITINGIGSWKAYPYPVTSTSQTFGISVDDGIEVTTNNASGNAFGGKKVTIRLSGNTTFSSFVFDCDKW